VGCITHQQIGCVDSESQQQWRYGPLSRENFSSGVEPPSGKNPSSRVGPPSGRNPNSGVRFTFASE